MNQGHGIANQPQQFFGPPLYPAVANLEPNWPRGNKSERSSVAGAIASIMGEIGGVAKGGTNQHFNYKFVEAQDIASAVQPLLAKHGLDIIQSERDIRIMDGDMLAVSFEFWLAHKDGSVWPVPVRHTGFSPYRIKTKYGMILDDKAWNKCHTAARKYFLIGLFNIPTKVDDADKDEVLSAANDNRAADNPEGAGRRGNAGSATVKRAEPAERPAPPETPQAIDFEHKKPIEWGSVFIAAIDTSKDIETIGAWVGTNEETLKQIGTIAPKVHERITARIDAAMQIKSPKQLTEPDLTIKLNKADQGAINKLSETLAFAKTLKELNEDWLKWTESTPSLAESRPMLDRAVALYETNKKRLKEAA